MVTMFGWLSADAVRASVSKRRRRSASSETECGNTLIATLRPRRTSRARKTSPMPPAPRGAVISYGPSRIPELTLTREATIYRLSSRRLRGDRRANCSQDRGDGAENDAVAVAEVTRRMNPTASKRRPVLAVEIFESHAARRHGDARVATGNRS